MVGASSQPVLAATGIYKRFVRGGLATEVLCGVDLAVTQGECAFLIGPSGCGKSTLLSILGCILSPDSGEVRILGKPLAGLDNGQRGRLRRDHIGFVFQRFHLIKGLTALENVCVPMTLQGRSASSAGKRGRELLAAIGMESYARHDTWRLSHGQCQRVAIARALANDPELILADEPTAALDQASGRQVMELLRRLLHEFNKTAVVVTHDSRTFEYADRILAMDGGRLQERAIERSSDPRELTAT